MQHRAEQGDRAKFVPDANTSWRSEECVEEILPNPCDPDCTVTRLASSRLWWMGRAPA